MSNLIKAFQIFRKYGDLTYPPNCEHDVMYVCVDPSLVSEEDRLALEGLGFLVDDTEFMSHHYGSC